MEVLSGRPSRRSTGSLGWLAGLLVMVLLLVPAASAKDRDRSAPLVAFVGATLWDGTGAAAIPNAAVLVRGGRIVGTGRTDALYVPPDAEIVDCTGLFIIPGLIDAHVHFFQSGGLFTRPDILDLSGVRPYSDDQSWVRASLDQTFRRDLASGVTSVVDMGGPFWNFDVRNHSRDLRARGEPAPRVAVAGPLISTVSRPQFDLGDPPIIQAKDPVEAAELAKRQLESKPDLLKVWFVLGPDGSVDLGRAIVEAVVREGHKKHIRVAVHATELASAKAAVEAGADILVHSIDDAPVDDAFLRLLAQRRIPWISTLVVYEGYARVMGQDVRLTPLERRIGAPEIIASWGDLGMLAPGRVPPEVLQKRVEKARARTPQMTGNLLAAHRAGVTVALGTDAGNIGTLHGPSVHRELELLVQAGFTNEEALLAATRDAAKVFAKRPLVGTLTPGKRADLLVLEANPLQDLANLERLRFVVVDGRRFAVDGLVAPNPEDVVAHQVEAYNARDLEAFLGLYAEDATLVRMPAGEVAARGRAELRRIYDEVFRQSPGLEAHILQRQVSGRYVTDHELVLGLRGGPPVRATAVYEVSDGRITTLWLFPKEYEALAPARPTGP